MLWLVATVGPIGLVYAMLHGFFNQDLGTDEEIPLDIDDDDYS